MEKLVMGRGQEVPGWGPGQGQQIKAGACPEVARRQGRGATQPRGQQGEWTLPHISRAPFVGWLVGWLIRSSCALCLEPAAGLALLRRCDAADARLSGQLFPGEQWGKPLLMSWARARSSREGPRVQLEDEQLPRKKSDPHVLMHVQMATWPQTHTWA